MRIPIRKFIVPLTVILYLAAVLAIPVRADVRRLVVNKAEDHDDGECTDADCTLREAIRIANDDGMDDLIAFDLPAPHLITITSLLPALTEDGTVIDGTTEPDYRTEPVVVLAPDRLLDLPVGLEIRAGRCAVRGLSLVRFSAAAGKITGAVYISGGEGNTVEKNHVGISPLPGMTGNTIGVHLASNGQTVRDNVISHNGKGVYVAEGIGKQTIQGNRIGTDPSGLKPEPNTNGIWLERDTFEVHIGGPGRGNLISGNDVMGIAALGYRHVIQSNLIGTDITGDQPLPNMCGIVLDGPGGDSLIGGTGPDEGNVISGNGDAGILIGDGAHTIQGNKIGTNADGARALGNGDGIVLTNFHSFTDGMDYESHDVVVGGVMGSGAENIISGNSFQGISILTSNHIIQGNLIGTDVFGRAAVPNDVGIDISFKGTNNMIGGTEPGLGNLISGNSRGVTILADGNTVVGNRIGTDRDGASAVRNIIGVQIFGSGNSIGTGAAGAGNVISGNRTGIAVEKGTGNRVLGNRIGTNADGSVAVPNSIGIGLGLDYDLDPADTVIGAPGAGNWIEHNIDCGMLIFNGVHGAQIVENIIAQNNASALGWCTGQGIEVVERGLEVVQITIRRNSIYRNAGLGIQFWGVVNGSIEPPTLTGGSLTHAEGTACPGCKVEIFKADVDPTGFGEGKTFLTETTAGGDGSFSTALTGVYVCDVLTATATDADGNTSEFSRNLGVMCLRLPPISVLLGIPGLMALFGFGMFFLVRGRGKMQIPAAIAGGLLGGGLGMLVLVMPFVRVNPPNRPAEPGTGQAPLTPCAQYLDEARMAPADQSTFEIGTDVRIEVYPIPLDPDAQIRWRLEVEGPGDEFAEREFTGGLSVLLSELGLNPSAPGTYEWNVSGEQLDPKTQQWTPLCQDRTGRVFRLRRGQLETPAEQIRPIETQPIPVSSAPVATLRNDANCRKGSGTDYGVVTVLPQGGTYPIDGRSMDGNWWWIRLPGGLGHCWVGGQSVEASGNTDALEVITPPPLGCWVYGANQQKVCAVPCPQDPKPGGVCEP